MIADGCLKPRENETPRQRFDRLNETFNLLAEEVRQNLSLLPAEAQLKMAEKLTALRRIHAVVVDEHICRPRG